MSFEPTREAGLARLAAFLDRAGRAYAANRNRDVGPGRHRHVSGLSPYLRHRLVTEEEVLTAVLARHGPEAAEAFIREVFWRSYFKGHLQLRPEIWRRYRAGLAEGLARLATDPDLARRVEAARAGRTGIACFDAWRHELVETGYLHNHARMWFASIWIFTLGLPWEIGADFTLRHFLDGDAASNTLSWRWVGGLHTPGKTYLARPDNIATYTEGRFRPDGLASEAPALVEAPLGKPRPLPAPPPVPVGPALLLLTEDDCHPESLAWDPAEIRTVAILPPRPRSPLGSAPLPEAFAEGALADAAARVADRFGLASTRCEPADLGALAREAGAVAILCAEPTVGPVSDLLETLAPDLPVPCLGLRRAHDARIWPKCGRGFFALKTEIPSLLPA